MYKVLPRLATLAGLLVLAACNDDTSNVGGLSVSGSVSGLTASGLVLESGRTTVTVPAGATSFGFGSDFLPGAGYEVTVHTQPASQICSVTNGSGTVSDASITNIAVSCAAASFSVGGTVSGLTGSGLVLANGGATVPIAPGATSFTFAATLAQGAAYAVTVATQPANQTCSVANSSGSVVTANVMNLVVTCAARGFALGGTVAGLTTSGLVLANGSVTVSVAANATTFTLPASVAVGSSYNVTVQTQPTGLACAVTHASGTMPSSAVTNVAVSCTDAPFSLGGSIAGLTSAGLVVANGSDTRQVAANASSFTMPTPVNYGSTYTLTVQTQPTGLSCSFSNGGNTAPSSGAMPAHNVANTALVCAPQSYTLGGAVSGLTSGTVVLANGSDTQSVTADGAFTMPTSVAYGSTYTVTVQTQPTGLTCTVGNATGTMPANNVTNVAVTCATSTYSVGGTVSGLTTTGLVLQNNGTDNTSVAANATQFTMPTAVAYGGTYTITVLTQPAGQTCAVVNGSGTVAAQVTNVQINCVNSVSFTTVGAASWTVPPGISSISVTAYGGGGGGGGCCGTSTGGNGALVTSMLAVQAGDAVTIYVAGGGATGQEGGGGGGLSYVGVGSCNFVIAGGGGGGGGGPGPNGNGGNAGSAGGAGDNGNNHAATGGAAGSNGAGGAAGSAGLLAPTPQYGETPGSAFTDIVTSASGSGGIGGGEVAGAAGGSGISNTIGNGGKGGDTYGAGGGGAGYGGGGGGGYGAGQSRGSGGGGGGGSTGPVGTTTVSVATTGGPGAGGAPGHAGSNGAVTISY